MTILRNYVETGKFPTIDTTYWQPTRPDDPAPSLEELQEWMEQDGGCEATDGCWVEPDGTCPHGCQSWLLKLGLI